jgi:hypothetical protein
MPKRGPNDHPNKVKEPAPDPAQERRDLERVTTITKARLHTLGVPVNDDDTPDELTDILEAIERFENVVRSRGGDLMVDEPPPGGHPQPDGENRALPIRANGEPAATYISRLERATELVSVRA